MPAPPPLDADGGVLPHDHAEIPADFHVIRYISPRDLHPESDAITRIGSGAYSESTEGGMSVVIEEWVVAAGLDPLKYAKDPTYGARRIRVGDLRALGLKVGWDPLPENQHHGAVWGIGNGSKMKRKVRDCAALIRKAEGET
jgi:hypothetical protein